MDLKPPPTFGSKFKTYGQATKAIQILLHKTTTTAKRNFSILGQVYSTCREWYNSIFENTLLPPSLHCFFCSTKATVFWLFSAWNSSTWLLFCYLKICRCSILTSYFFIVITAIQHWMHVSKMIP